MSRSLLPPADVVEVSEEVPERAPTRSIVPMPDVAPILEEAQALRAIEDWDGALAAYKKALFVVPAGAKEVQASIYASVAEVKHVQKRPAEAESNYEKALVAHPHHGRSLEGLVALATEAEDWPRLAAARRRRAEAFEDPDDRATELCLVAEIEETKLGSAEKALATLEIASVHRPGDVGILLKLRDLHTALRAWPQVVAVHDELVRLSSDVRHRGAYRFAQADVMLGRLREEPRGLAFLEMALDEDPQCDRALSALIAVRTRREEWPELAAVYERLLDRYAGLGDRDRAWEVCRKLATLRRDRLLDGPGALEAMAAAVDLRPDDAETRATLAELHAAKGDRTAAVRELEIASVHAPLRAQTYRRLVDLHRRAGRLDRAWLAATCLEDLGASDVEQELMIEQYRPDGPIKPAAAVEDAWWELLEAHGADPIASSILETVGPAAIQLRVEERGAPRLDERRKQDASSTASAVRTFVWAARALGITAPELYTHESAGVAALQAAAPAVALGPSVLAGRSVQELAFLAGRHLAYYRRAVYPLVFFPTLAELSSLVLTAVRLVIPGISVPPGGSRVQAELGARLSAEEKERLREAVAKLEARGGKLDLASWIRGVELTAHRAGLLLCGDLRIARRVMKDEARAIADLGPDAKRSDLLPWCASEAYGLLRERMGVAIRGGTGS